MSSKTTVRRQSAVFLAYVHQLPRWAPLILLPALLIAGMAIPGPVGAIPLILLAFVVWFLFMATPPRNTSHLLIRYAVPLLLVAVAVAKLLA
ncbi:DUF6703 family protein [Actinomadura sp. DC4]|uniref:DUF6703 family protein n=1 Tax=Actinomadura sp. DC4 TaxID=3055069 RepID=UPI0025B0861C|nr:DUF6703 family protein [Actinomadura sp. DC4]MDN3353441.1 hypothetical protein [Actinomadura sp. DC4]